MKHKTDFRTFLLLLSFLPHFFLFFFFPPFSFRELVTMCGNKMSTRCNRAFYCRSYCLLNMFRAPLCPSSGAQEYYTVVAACGISCGGFSSSWSGVELRVMCPVCRMLLHLAGILFPHTLLPVT